MATTARKSRSVIVVGRRHLKTSGGRRQNWDSQSEGHGLSQDAGTVSTLAASLKVVNIETLTSSMVEVSKSSLNTDEPECCDDARIDRSNLHEICG